MRSVTQKYLEKIGEVTFDKIFNQRLGKQEQSHSVSEAVINSIALHNTGFLLFKQYCEDVSDEPVPQLAFYEEVNVIFFLFLLLLALVCQLTPHDPSYLLSCSFLFRRCCLDLELRCVTIVDARTSQL